MDEMDFKLLQLLNEKGNITHAADQLYITQSALSKRIKAIEQELGIEIMIRSRHGVRFTPAGEIVFAHSLAAAKEMEKMREDLAGIGGEICGTLRVGVSITYAQYVFPDILASYRRRFPAVKLLITTEQSHVLHSRLLSGNIDIAILRGEHFWDGERFLLSQDAICVVHNQELAGQPLSELFYISHKTDPTLEGLQQKWLRENDLAYGNAGIIVDSVSSCLELVRRGLGWGLLPEISLKDYKGCFSSCIFADGEPFVRRTYIMFRQEIKKLRQAKAFIETVKKLS